MQEARGFLVALPATPLQHCTSTVTAAPSPMAFPALSTLFLLLGLAMAEQCAVVAMNLDANANFISHFPPLLDCTPATSSKDHDAAYRADVLSVLRALLRAGALLRLRRAAAAGLLLPRRRLHRVPVRRRRGRHRRRRVRGRQPSRRRLARRVLRVLRGHQRVVGPRGRLPRLVLPRRRRRRRPGRGVRGRPSGGGVRPVPERVGASGAGTAAVEDVRRRGGGGRIRLLPSRPDRQPSTGNMVGEHPSVLIYKYRSIHAGMHDDILRLESPSRMRSPVAGKD